MIERKKDEGKIGKEKDKTEKKEKRINQWVRSQ